ncbi:hypothetical protein EV421DRAFT_1739258 [Armillaria borealis]|uniref:Uncharacterized protein n=1 Tax=Armillaria borealis TaxID=47425 RepID=A0AA39MKI4_9AGAR|nr:hypothetical protein EV421DRAFT_1739258 [Armillaria borealis]
MTCLLSLVNRYGNENSNIGFRVDPPPANPMDINIAVEETIIRKEQVVKKVKDMPAMQAAHTIADLVEYSASKDNGSGENEKKIEKVQIKEEARKKEIAAGKKKKEKSNEADNKREEEKEEFD